MPGSSQWRPGHLGAYFRGKERISSALSAGSKTHLLRRPGEDPLARYRARSGRAVPAQSISEIIEMIVLLAKWAFPPTWRVLECGKRVWKKQNNPPRHLRHLKLLVAGAELSSCSPLMYRFEVGDAACILIEAHSHTLSSLDGSNFRAHPPSHGSGA